MRRWQTWLGVFVVVAFCGCGASILAPVFMSAKAAARDTKVYDRGSSLAQALRTYVDAHAGKLPGRDWRTQIVRIDPSLAGRLTWRVDSWRCGFAAVPGTFGKTLDQLPDDTVLYVETSSTEDMAVLDEVSSVGNAGQPQRALAITASGLMTGGYARFRSTTEIAYLIGRQGATFKDRFGNL